MKANLLRILSLVLCMAMLLGLAPMVQLIPTASAAELSAKGDCGVDHTAFTLVGTDQAVTTIPASGNIKLTTPIELAAAITVAADTQLHIDLNGCDITCTAGANMFVVKGTLTICDSLGTGALDASSNDASAANGIVSVTGGTFYLYGGTLSGHTTTGKGGGVYMSAGRFDMNGGIITDNLVSDTTDKCAEGGGVYASGGTFNMNAGTISENTAYGTKHNTKATGGGGGVCLRGATMVMNGGSICNNNAKGTMNTGAVPSGGGGILYVTGSLTIKGGTISSNDAELNGGGIRKQNAQMTIKGGTISRNTAASGGGIWVNGGKNLTISGGEISENNADSYGGIGISGTAGMTMTAGNIINNNATVTDGGGIGGFARGSVTIQGGVISGNEAERNGGAIYVNGSNDSGATSLTISGGHIINNSAKNHGGGIYVVAGVSGKPVDVTISGGEVSGNKTTGTKKTGGAICLNNYNTLTVKGGVIAGNKATNGGAVGTAGTVEQKINIEGGLVAANDASTGAAIFSNACTLNISGGWITGNTGSNSIIVSGSTVTMTGGRISGNSNAVKINNYLVASTATFSGDAIVEDVIQIAKKSESEPEKYPADSSGEVGALNPGATVRFQTEDNLEPTIASGVTLKNEAVTNGVRYTHADGRIAVQYNLDLDSKIDFSFYIKKADLPAEGLTATITHYIADSTASTQSVVQTNWESVRIGSVDYWRIRYTGVAAKQLADVLTLVVTDSESNRVLVDITSAKEYAELCIEKSSDTNLVKLMTEVLNYGSAAQVNFNYNTGYLASGEVYNTLLEDLQTPQSSGVKYNLDLGNEIDFSFYVDKNAVAASGLTSTIVQDLTGVAVDRTETKEQDVEWETVTDTDGTVYWRIRYECVAAKEMTENLTLTIAGTEINATSCVEDYAILVINNEDAPANLRYLMSALLAYGAAAQKYFNYNTGDLAGSANA